MAFIGGVADSNGYGWAIAKVRSQHTDFKFRSRLKASTQVTFFDPGSSFRCAFSSKALAEAGATIAVGTWPPVLGIFKATLESGKLEEDLKTSAGDKWEIAKVGWGVGSW